MSKPSWAVQITVGDAAKGSACVYPAPAALPGVDLPKLLVVRGPDGHAKLVGAERVDGAADSDAVFVSPALFKAVVPRPEGPIVEATLEPASRWAVFVFADRATTGKIVAAVLVLLAALAGAGVAFATRKVGLGVGLGVLLVVVLAALFTARNTIRDALTPKCG